MASNLKESILSTNACTNLNVLLRVLIHASNKKVVYTIKDVYIIKLTDAFIESLFSSMIFKTFCKAAIYRSLNGWGCCIECINKIKYLYHPFFTRYYRDDVILPKINIRRKAYSRLHSKNIKTVKKTAKEFEQKNIHVIFDEDSIEINKDFNLLLMKQDTCIPIFCDTFKKRILEKNADGPPSKKKKHAEIEPPPVEFNAAKTTIFDIEENIFDIEVFVQFQL